MTPPKTETNTKNTPSVAAPIAQTPSPVPAVQASKAKTKAVTIQLTEDVHQKLRIVALSKGATTSGLVEAYVEAALKKDLVLAVAKLSE